jgi:hypothetical protein
MKLVFLHGAPAVGKLTVAKALLCLVPGRLFDNHAAMDLALTVFDFGVPRILGVGAFGPAVRSGSGSISRHSRRRWRALIWERRTPDPPEGCSPPRRGRRSLPDARRKRHRMADTITARRGRCAAATRWMTTITTAAIANRCIGLLPISPSSIPPIEWKQCARSYASKGAHSLLLHGAWRLVPRGRPIHVLPCPRLEADVPAFLTGMGAKRKLEERGRDFRCC